MVRTCTLDVEPLRDSPSQKRSLYYYYYYEIVHEVQKADFKQSTHRDGPKQLTNRAPFNHVTDIS